jgi:hypothetical protein
MISGILSIMSIMSHFDRIYRIDMIEDRVIRRQVNLAFGENDLPYMSAHPIGVDRRAWAVSHLFLSAFIRVHPWFQVSSFSHHPAGGIAWLKAPD